jgi:hypothetical protein
MMSCSRSVFCALSLLAAGSLGAATVPVPNASFESPATPFADPRLDAWQDMPKPPWFEETPEVQWDFLTGVFLNLPPVDPGTIANCDGLQAMFLFASPQAGVFQDYDSVDWAGTTHAFSARFEPGYAYQLTVGVMGAGPIRAGASLALGLYYRTPAGESVTLAATPVVYTPPGGSGPNLLTDYTVRLAAVRPTEPWAGAHIGIQILSTVLDPDLVGGYWDIDNVRLTAIRAPVLTAPALTNGKFGFVIEGEPGLACEVFAGTDPARPLHQWTSLGTVANPTGTVSFVDPSPASGARFYQARLAP